ncbi:MAG: LacI family DNA-binding transcriptional regulator [Caulobacteraceae bacterium]|nr:LacI family DNA-binding transcriptional regulator [Caulobacter sp.]
MADLARLAGVSTSTVSRALAGSALVPQATRREIEALAARHGYVANLGARRLRTARTDVVAVVFPLAHEQGQPISDPFFLELVGHLADAVSARGCDTLLIRVPAPTEGWLERLWQSGRADGVLVIGQSDQHEALNAAAAAGAPMVVWGARRADQRYCTVGVDNEAGARAATEHLLAAGRRRIAFVGGADAPEFADRRRGYEAALRASGLAPDPERELQTHLSGDDLAAPLMARLEADPEIDAVVCATDMIAVGVVRALLACGRRVPQDVAVTGFDDIAAAALTSPGLTTVRQDLAAGADAMVERLFALAAGRPAESLEMPAPLVLRDTTP